ncbi:hypothetical protein ASO20_02440 [Mycoplasma sp. (ex Biomphalaria glabrata)]|uniref:hypothetical protein n=1 Tax=Mycoplasma sp. (ex Biomphalaria glabrata) TaxID=1749074 RepID=UPI00073A9CCE|nr:hypothetical protein [Mycoplasma sp. (ex Biomphalaria glabrata)]ALV23493.1 hypothetical protein ASO20_02440 [Mycoplasma sp. (ex Biomphalaria glabrata)]
MYSKQNKVVATGLWLNMIVLPWFFGWMMVQMVDYFYDGIQLDFIVATFAIFLGILMFGMFVWTSVIILTDHEVGVLYTVLSFFVNIFSFILFIACYVVGSRKENKINELNN